MSMLHRRESHVIITTVSIKYFSYLELYLFAFKTKYPENVKRIAGSLI